MGDYLQRHRRKTRLERAAAKELLYAASIKKAVQFLDLFKKTLDVLGDGSNWVVADTQHPDGGSISKDSIMWIGDKKPLEIISPVLDKWEEEINGKKKEINKPILDNGSREVITAGS